MRDVSNFEYDYCGICETKCKKKSMQVQDGTRRCKKCIDEKIKDRPLKWAWGSGRPNPTSTTAVTSPTVFSITVAGITPSHSQVSEKTYNGQLGISNAPSVVQFGSYYYMKVVGDGGAINISANPQITAGQKFDRICIEGTDNTNTILLENGTGLSLAGGVSFTLKNGSKIILTYSGDNWVENSRVEN